MPADFLLYGSYGYTGRLIAERARELGLAPLLAGRDGAALAAQGEETGLPFRAFALDDAAALDAALRETRVVVHAAGPFSRTAAPMAEACLRTGAHYLDITGEIAVFEALAARDRQAREAGVMLLPGVGFDVVPSDCLAAHLKRRLPSATRLALAFQAVGRPSRGTLTTMVENAARGGAVRRGGRGVRRGGTDRRLTSELPFRTEALRKKRDAEDSVKPSASRSSSASLRETPFQVQPSRRCSFWRVRCTAPILSQ